MDFLIEKGAKRGTTTITEKLKYDKALECEDYLDKLETQKNLKSKKNPNQKPNQNQMILVYQCKGG